MNVLFLTMVKVDVEKRGIYNDLMRKFRNEGHQVYVVSPSERRENMPTRLVDANGVHVLNVKTLNVQKTNVIEKGLGQVSIEFLYKRAIKKYFGNVRFDLILYSTPPITFPKVIKYAKQSNPNAKTYLMLKDIFPQNAVDMGMLSKSGVKGILYKYFRNKEKTLYALSDFIGCMSPANVKYVLEHNPEVALRQAQGPIVEVAPNSVELQPEGESTNEEARKAILDKYGIPSDKPVFIYGGNLGVPQGIPFLIDCLEANKNRTDCHFVVVGNGTFYQKLADWYESNLEPSGTLKPSETFSVTVMKGLPKEEYDQLVRACNVGLIFLDYRFTIPNYPSRLLSYLEYKMPVIACTDPNCDTGTIAQENNYGIWVPSNDVKAFGLAVDEMLRRDIKSMGSNGYEFLQKNYTVDNTYNAIMKHF